MFAIGRAHDCAACTTADEVHDGRHREIAALVKEYESLTSMDSEETTTRNKAAQPENLHSVVHNGRQARQMERGDTGIHSATSTSIERITDRPFKAEQRAYKKAIKHEKSLKKSAKNSERYTISLRQSDIDAVTKALHGDLTGITNGTGHLLATDQNLEDPSRRPTHYKKPKKPRKSGKSTNADESSADSDSEELVRGVLLELGIDVSSTGTERPDRFSTTPAAKIAAVLQKLKTAILEDLAKHENDERQTCIRAGGFWRWVGKPVFDRMTEIAQRIDWRTGMIIKERADEVEVEVEGGDVDMNENEGENQEQEE